VALTPGGDFDTAEGDRFVRLSFAGSLEEIQEGLVRLAAWL
jgi:aspartate/methionine/tyrosine aminotransferase